MEKVLKEVLIMFLELETNPHPLILMDKHKGQPHLDQYCENGEQFLLYPNMNKKGKH